MFIQDSTFQMEETSEIIKEWNRLKESIEKQPAIRQITIEAWNRCRELNVDPSNLKYTFLSKQEEKQKLQLNDSLIKAASPYMDYLSLSLSGIPHIVTLLDKEAWVIDIRGDAEEAGGKSKGFCIGASWREEHIGNNGGGTPLRLKKPAFIYGCEHFANVFKSYSCLGVPIFKDKKVIGCLDVSVPNEYAHPGRLTITMACVDAIEKEIAKVPENNKSGETSRKLIATAELMATAVHDLKNPLASIRGLAQLGKLTSSSITEQSYFDRIIKQVDSLNNSVVDLQNIFKPEEPVMVDPSKIIREVLDEAQPSCEILNVNLIFTNNFAGELSLHVKLFRRALENLIKNAVQALSGNGNIKVNLSQNENQLLISVNDDGPGIPDEIKKKLFQPFAYHRKDGTGLGLFMVYHAIVEVHGGEIWYESELGKGTTFYLSLPKK